MSLHCDDRYPAADESERAFAAMLAIDPAYVLPKTRAARLCATDLLSPHARALWNAAVAVHARDGAADQVSLLAEMERVGLGDDGRRYLAEIVGAAPPVVNVDVHLKALRRASVQRGLLRAAEAARIAALRGDLDPASALADLATIIEAERADAADPARALPWVGVADVLKRAAETPRSWLLPRVLPFGAIVLLVGGGKVSGKSTLTWAIVSNALRGLDLFGRGLPCGAVEVVVLTEETEIDLAEKIRAFGIDPRDSRLSILTRGSCSPLPSWREVGAQALARCASRKARILVVDTWARWTRIPDDGANKEGPTLEALDVLDPARREGILVLVPHHPSKAEGREGGNAARGSSALPGEVDATVELRNDRHDGDPNRRRLHVESRASGVFDLLISLKRGDGQDKPDRYDEVGEVEEVRRREVAERVVAFVGSHPGSTGPEIEAGADTRGRDVQGALPRLSCDPPRRLLRTGGGKAGDPFRYWPVGTVPPSNNGSPPSPSALPPAEMLDLGNRESPSPSAPRKGAGRRRRSRAVRAKPGASVSVSANGSAITPSETPS